MSKRWLCVVALLAMGCKRPAGFALSETTRSNLYADCLPEKGDTFLCVVEGSTTGQMAEVTLEDVAGSVDDALAPHKVPDMAAFAGPDRKGTQELSDIVLGARQGKLLKISLVTLEGRDDEPANFWVVALPQSPGHARSVFCSSPNAEWGATRCGELISAVMRDGMPKLERSPTATR